MKKFIFKISLFVFLISIIFIIGILLPPTPRVRETLLFAKPTKDSLLKNVKSPRLILIGGSSVSMSINSQLIKDSLHVNPINTGIQAPIGLVFMLDNTLDYIQKGDVIVIAPEYQQFFGNFAYGQEELLRTVFDVELKDISKLNLKQINNIYAMLPKYALTKYKPSEYKGYDGFIYYRKDCFNQYGDACFHWKMQKENKIIMSSFGGEYNEDILNRIIEFNKKITEKGAKLYLTYPPFEDRSFDPNVKSIKKVEAEFEKSGLVVMGNPFQYRTTIDMMFDTPYHMNKKGLDQRTQMLIKELKLHNAVQ